MIAFILEHAGLVCVQTHIFINIQTKIGGLGYMHFLPVQDRTGKVGKFLCFEFNARRPSLFYP